MEFTGNQLPTKVNRKNTIDAYLGGKKRRKGMKDFLGNVKKHTKIETFFYGN